MENELKVRIEKLNQMAIQLVIFTDIEFVKQTIGHQRLDTTSTYVNKLSDQERQERISQID